MITPVLHIVFRLQVWILDDQHGFVLAKIMSETPGKSMTVLRQTITKGGHFTDEGTPPVVVPLRCVLV